MSTVLVLAVTRSVQCLRCSVAAGEFMSEVEAEMPRNASVVVRATETFPPQDWLEGRWGGWHSWILADARLAWHPLA